MTRAKLVGDIYSCSSHSQTNQLRINISAIVKNKWYVVVAKTGRYKSALS